MKLSIIIVSYNVRHYLEQCLLSVARAAQRIAGGVEVFVVDNHSHDDTVEHIQRHYPDVRLIASNHNLGFSRANNLAIRQSTGDYVLLLNPDTFVGESVLGDTLQFMDGHPDAGALGVQMLGANGQKARESRRGLPSPMTAFYKMSGLCARFPKSTRFGHYYMSDMPWDEAGQIEVVSGAFFLLRHSTMDAVGLLDEDFFMYGEDIDLSCRILKAGFQNWYFPARILHYKGESTQKSSFRYVHVFYDAMLIFFRKHYSQLSLFISLPIRLAIGLKASLALVSMLWHRVRKMLGFFDRRHAEEPTYLFIGREQALAQCRRIARKRGLKANFMEADAQTCPGGHHAAEGMEADKPLYAVYDTDAYSFDQILALMAETPQANVMLGTYNRQTQTIVTQQEILA